MLTWVFQFLKTLIRIYSYKDLLNNYMYKTQMNVQIKQGL